MDVVGERILIVGDSLTHHGSDDGPEIWDVNVGSNRASSAPGDLLASMLLEQGAQAVRTDANVGRSAHNFWAGTARHQHRSAADLIADDQAWGPTKVIVMLGTNDADSGAIDAAAMQAIRDSFGNAEVWAVGPPIFVNDALNAKVDQVYSMMSGIFGSRLIDARPLSTTVGRAGDGVHFQPIAAQQFALQLHNALLTTSARKPWLGYALGVGIFGFLTYVIWNHYRPGQLGTVEYMGPEHEADDEDFEGPSMLQTIASESRTPEEYARRAEAWASTEAKPPSDQALVRAFPGASSRMIRTAREARQGSSRQRFESLINEPEDKGLDGVGKHDLNVLAQAASFGEVGINDLAPESRTVARISPTLRKRTQAAWRRLQGLETAGLLEVNGVHTDRFSITDAGRAELTTAGYTRQPNGYWAVPGAPRPSWM